MNIHPRNMYMVCRVDSLVVFAKEKKQLLNVMMGLRPHFKLKDLG